ncbi:MAG: entericidin A/B family lipoprotein [Sphingomonadaceae bacterium]|jgi:predicted small secreted protein
MTRTIVTVLTASLALIVSACNTVEGAGKDLQSAGSAVEGAAK